MCRRWFGKPFAVEHLNSEQVVYKRKFLHKKKMDGMLSSLLGKKRGKNLDDAACGSGISSGALQVFSHGYIV